MFKKISQIDGRNLGGGGSYHRTGAGGDLRRRGPDHRLGGISSQ